MSTSSSGTSLLQGFSTPLTGTASPFGALGVPYGTAGRSIPPPRAPMNGPVGDAAPRIDPHPPSLHDAPTRHPPRAALRLRFEPRVLLQAPRRLRGPAGRHRAPAAHARPRCGARSGSRSACSSAAAPGCCTSRRSRSRRSRSSRRSLAGGVVLLAVMADRMFGFKVGRRQWWGLALTAVGLVLLAITLPAHRRLAPAFSVPAMIAFEGGLFGVGALLIMGPRPPARPPSTTASCSPPPSGILFGVCNVAVKALTGIVGHDGVLGARQPLDRRSRSSPRPPPSTPRRAACRTATPSRSSRSPAPRPTSAASPAASSSSATRCPRTRSASSCQAVAFVLVIVASALTPAPRSSRAGSRDGVAVASSSTVATRAGSSQHGPWPQPSSVTAATAHGARAAPAAPGARRSAGGPWRPRPR